MLDLLSKAMLFFINKKRLVIEYVMIGIIVTVAGFVLNMWLSKKDSDKHLAQAQAELSNVKGRLSNEEFINDQQEAHIRTLNDLRERDARALAGLATDYKSLASRNSVVKKRLENLEKSNEVIKDYVSTPVPPDIVCLLRPATKGCSINDSRTPGATGSPIPTP